MMKLFLILQRNLIVCCVAFFVLTAATCSETSPIRPMEIYNSKHELHPPPSIIYIPIRIDKAQIQQQLNAQLEGDLYHDSDMSNDGLTVKASKREAIEIIVKPDILTYKVPLNLLIQKKVAFTTVEAEGSIDIYFETAYQLHEDWQLTTQTTVIGYDWQQRPVLKLGFADLPIQRVANIILNRTKDYITTAIDEQAQKSVNLPEKIQQAWSQLHQPVEISKEYNTYLLPNPASISMAPLTIAEDTIETVITIETKPHLVVGTQPLAPINSPLPPFKYRVPKNDDFNIQISTEIPYSQAEHIAKSTIVGESFSASGQSVTIKDIEIYGQGNKLVVGTLLEGSYNGKIYLTGKPFYNKEKETIELEDAAFDFSSKRFLMRSLSWLFKGNLKKKLQESMDFHLSMNLQQLQELIEKQLSHYQIADGITLHGSLNQIQVNQLYLTPDAIRITVLMSGKVQVEVSATTD